MQQADKFKKLLPMTKVFISSTSKDLDVYRQAAYKAVQKLDGYHGIIMENFGARDNPPEVFCPDKVKECDLFILLLGLTYGSCPPDSDKSYTELEYEAAIKNNKPCLLNFV